MSKTTFVDGSPLTANFCNTIYSTGGGHVHDGADADGHSSKIVLTSQVTGLLPFANITLSPLFQDSMQGFNYVKSLTVCPSLGAGNYDCLSISPGSCLDSNRTYVINSTSVFLKAMITPALTAFAYWGQGTGYGGMALGNSLGAANFYYVFAISKVDGTVDYGFDGSYYAAGLMADTNVVAAGFVYYRRIGTIRMSTGGGGGYIRSLYQIAGDHLFGSDIADYSGSSDVAWTAKTLVVPISIMVKAHCTVTVTNASTATLCLRDGVIPDDAVSGHSNDGRSFVLPAAGSIVFQTDLVTNTTGQIYEKYLTSAPSNIIINHTGYYDYRID